MAEYLIGLMSGTSLDGVDAVLVNAHQGSGISFQVCGHCWQPYPEAVRTELLALNQAGPDELHRAALAANDVARSYAQTVAQLLRETGCPPHAVRALGAHGQTVRHRPGEFDGSGYTAQLLNGALLAELTDIDVVCDFRSRDVAAGGQGAPLVPAFHAAVFGRAGEALAVLNIGGMANLSLMAADGRVTGFDVGPGNALMDAWCQQQRGEAFDRGGAWAASGQADSRLLAQMLAEPFFQRTPPKSTGRDLFDRPWLAHQLALHGAALPAANVQATLARLTVDSIADALRQHLPEAPRLMVCGGGALNLTLMAALQAALPGVAVASTAEAGLSPMQVEATAFAWLAQAFLARRPGNLPAVTGAAGPRVLGALYPAR